MKRIILCMLILGLLMAACSPATPQPTLAPAITAPVVRPSATSDPGGQTGPTSPTAPSESAAEDETASPPAAQTANCASAAANQLGAAIAQGYDFTSTEQVMTWFCDGAEFEDILVALETADQTGASAEEMLIMLAAGLTWEEIWKEVGLTD
jgi:hypothetical protein